MATESTVEDMTVYDADKDPREARDNMDDPRPKTLPSPDGWLLQVNVKTPGGTLVNVRGMDGWDLTAGLQTVQTLAREIKQTEDALGVSIPQAVQQLGPRPVPQAPPQQPRQQFQQRGGYQQAPQQQPQDGPLCNCGYPARFVPGGISKKTNKAYRAFWACGNPVREAECSFRADG